MTPAELAALALVGWSSAVASVSLFASGRAVLGRRVTASPPAPWRVLVVRPCAGMEPSLERTLLSSRGLGGVAFRLVFAVEREDDPAHAVARGVSERLRAEGLDASVLVTHARGVNRKASQLARAVAASPPCDVVVNVDSDVDCGALPLASLLAPLADPRVAASWAPPVEAGGPTWGDRASEALLAGSLHAFPVLSRIDPGGLVGKVFAVRRGALDRVGGFASFEACLGEDMELARRLRALGLAVRAADVAAVSLAAGRAPRAVVERYARWLAVIRAQRPALMATYPLLFFATPLVALAAALALALPGLTPRAAWGAALAVALAAAARALVALAARRASGLPLARAFADIPLADGLLMAAFAGAMRRREVRWRGRALTIERGGLLREAAYPAASTRTPSS